MLRLFVLHIFAYIHHSSNINPFLNSMPSTNHERVNRHSANIGLLVRGLFLFYKQSSFCPKDVRHENILWQPRNQLKAETISLKCSNIFPFYFRIRTRRRSYGHKMDSKVFNLQIFINKVFVCNFSLEFKQIMKSYITAYFTLNNKCYKYLYTRKL